MSRPVTQKLLDAFPIISDQIGRSALEVVLGELESVLRSGVAGDVAEFGCYIGTTSLFIRRMLDAYKCENDFHIYDSFEGLPAKSAQDSSPVGADFREGELKVSKKQLLEQFHKARLRPPKVHKGWFNELTADDVPSKIAFAFLDGDFYESIMDSLQLVYPRMQPGGVICIDDAGREALPGVDRAIHDFFQSKNHSIKISHNIAIIAI